jgi:hypothetical protein
MKKNKKKKENSANKLLSMFRECLIAFSRVMTEDLSVSEQFFNVKII